jgi:hypothetical protein
LLADTDYRWVCGTTDRQYRVEISIECANDPAFAAGIFEYLLVPGSAQIALACMDNVPAIRAQQLDRGARQPLVEQQSYHAASSGRI